MFKTGRNEIYKVYILIVRCFTRLYCNGYTFSLWLKISQAALTYPARQGIFSSGGEGRGAVVNGGIALYLFQDQLRLKLKTNGGTPIRQDLYADIPGRGDQWLHVAGTWKQNGAARLYIDGAEVSVTWSTFSPLPSSINYLLPIMQVGRLSSLNYYGEFTLDEWYFWDTELTGDQVKQIYDAYKTGR